MIGLRRGLVAALVTLTVAAGCSGGDEPDAAPTSDLAPPTEETTEETTTADTDTGTEAEPEPGAAPASPAGFDLDAVLAADPSCADPVTGDPLRIGYAADLGPVGGAGDLPASQAASHFASLINCSGGLEGRPVEVIVEDISGDALATREAMLRLLAADPHVLLGPPFPDPGFRVLQVTDGARAVVFTSSTEPALGNATELSYLVAFNDTQGATAAARFALDQEWGRAVTFSFPGPYFGYNSVVFTEAYQSGGGTVIADYPFIPGETLDFADVVPAIVADPPDVIYSAMFAEQIVALQEELLAAGVTVRFIGSDAYEATGGYSLPLPPVNDIYHVTHAAPDSPRVALLNQSLLAATGAESSAPSMAALAGDAIAVIADAYLRVQTTDPRVLGLAIAEGAEVDGVTGMLTYGGGGAPTKPMYIHQLVDGQPVLAATITP